jgi:hypothetical protein
MSVEERRQYILDRSRGICQEILDFLKSRNPKWDGRGHLDRGSYDFRMSGRNIITLISDIDRSSIYLQHHLNYNFDYRVLILEFNINKFELNYLIYINSAKKKLLNEAIDNIKLIEKLTI